MAPSVAPALPRGRPPLTPPLLLPMQTRTLCEVVPVPDPWQSMRSRVPADLDLGLGSFAPAASIAVAFFIAALRPRSTTYLCASSCTDMMRQPSTLCTAEAEDTQLGLADPTDLTDPTDPAAGRSGTSARIRPGPGLYFWSWKPERGASTETGTWGLSMSKTTARVSARGRPPRSGGSRKPSCRASLSGSRTQVRDSIACRPCMSRVRRQCQSMID